MKLLTPFDHFWINSARSGIWFDLILPEFQGNNRHVQHTVSMSAMQGLLCDPAPNLSPEGHGFVAPQCSNRFIRRAVACPVPPTTEANHIGAKTGLRSAHTNYLAPQRLRRLEGIGGYRVLKVLGGGRDGPSSSLGKVTLQTCIA